MKFIVWNETEEDKFFYKNNIDRINSENILLMPTFKLNRIVKKMDRKMWAVFRRRILQDFYENNFEIDFIFITNFKKIIKKLRIPLTNQEENHIKKLENIFFSLKRTWKRQQTSIFLEEKNNICWFIFDGSHFFEKKQNNFIPISKVTISIFDTYFVFQSINQEFQKIYFNSISKINLDSTGIEIHSKGKIYLVTHSPIEELVVALVRIFKKNKIFIENNFNKKIKKIFETKI